ncbi:MAG: ATP-dependent helicase [Actinomycetota bacterium]|nr:ATP-dependent helicase [Actinomycetota bacterium]
MSRDEGLDTYQQAAVAHGDGPAIVLAGPGSGKTSVIVERVVRLIEEERARPEELLVLTFSRKAAADLRERIAARLQRSYASFPVTTFHAFCLALLTRNATEPPRLARPAERRAAATKALAAEGNLGLRPTNALVDEALAFAALCDDYLEVPEHDLARVRERYIGTLADAAAVDYGGLQRDAVALLENEVETREANRQMFRYILVDEYQDTNVAQERLLEILGGDNRNVFCVADEDQSIYGFRGAEIENALGFLERWPGAVRYDLPTNYRSAPRIVELATSVIRRNVSTHLGKKLASAEERPAEIVGQTFRHTAEEAAWVAREVAALRLKGTELSQVAVVARSLKQIGPRLAYELRSHGIPFYAPLELQLHSTADALLSLLELAGVYPWTEEHDDQAIRALASPLFRADPLELRRFRREPRTVYGALRDSGHYDGFFEALAIIKRQHSAGAAIYVLWERLPQLQELQTRDATREQIEELSAVTALSDAANEFDGELADFPRAFRAGELASEEWLPSQATPADAVALLTVHQAKGLEWDAVFICDLVEGRFPALSRSQYALFDRELFARRPLDEAERARRALEEERRLFYVALTRARTHLFLTATEEAREEAGRALSRFYLEAQPFLGEARKGNGFVSSEEALAALRRAGGGPAGWRERTTTENVNRMLPTGGLWTSASRLAPYENCPLQFFYGSLAEVGRARTTAMRLGSAFHDVLEAFHDPERNEPQTLERLLELAEEQSFEDVRPRPLGEEQRRLLEWLLRNYYAHEVAPGIDGGVLAVERRFRFDLDASTVSGYIDRIDRLEDGRLRLIDYKTSKSVMKIDEAEQDLQLALYALACRDVPQLRELGDVGELVYLYVRHTARGKITRRGQAMTSDLTDRTAQRVRDLVARIGAEEFDFSETADCTFCDFKPICPRHHGRDVPL